MIWQNLKKNRSGPKGSGNQEISAQVETVVYVCLQLRAEALKPDSVACPGEMVCLEVVGHCSKSTFP